MQPQQRPEDTRNLIIAVGLCMAILFGFDAFILGPQRKIAHQARNAEIARTSQNPGAGPAAVAPPAGPIARAAAIAANPRVAIETPTLSGSLSLTGGRIDDLTLQGFRETTKAGSPNVTLFTPQGAAQAWYGFFGWLRPGQNSGISDLPGPDTLWRLESGTKLTPETPITLVYDSAEGVRFTRQISVDAQYLFTLTDQVENLAASAQTLTPFGIIRRHGLAPGFKPDGVVHEGAIGVLAGKREQKQWKTLHDPKKALDVTSTGGFIGLTDKYWLAGLIPDQSEQFLARASVNPAVPGERLYEATYFGQARTLGAGENVAITRHFFVGAKKVEVLRFYQKSLNVPRLDEAVDWGNFWFLTRPFFEVLHFFNGWTGNFGAAILLLTLVVRAFVFPLADSSYKSMAKMRKYQPQIQDIQNKYKDDKPRQSQEMMALFQREKINPVAGCFPLLLQMPIFFALYKTLTVTIEMRHAPFFGWIRDLSAPDPTSWVNLFGLLPFDAPVGLPIIGGLFAIGIWPLLYGVTMWLVQSMSPPAQDPVQRVIFQWMPVLFTFLFGGFAAGLVIYWTWSNVLSIIQQQFMMRRYGVETELDKLLHRIEARLKPRAANDITN